MKEMLFIGIDPGCGGGMAVLDVSGKPIESFTTGFKKLTDLDLAKQVLEISLLVDTFPAITTIEKVHSMPKQGISSTFKFGFNYGMIIGMFYMTDCVINHVTPQTWQKSLQCLTKGDKNVTKQRAQELFPNIKITHAIADALLIAEYGRQDWLKRNGKGC